MSRTSPDAVAEGFVSAINAHDLDAALDFWAEDALFLPIEGDGVVGREAIRELLSALTTSGTSIEIETASTYVAGDTAVREGRLKLIGGAGADSGFEAPANYITIYRRDQDGWKIVIDAPAGFPATLPV